MSRLLLPAPRGTLASSSGTLNKHDFKLVSNLGQGSFGKVYQVTHLPTGDSYAIKVVSKDKMKNSSMLKQIQNEIGIMQNIDHPNIVKLITHFENEANIYLVLELGGINLYAALYKEKQFDEKKAAKFIYETASAIYYLHSQTPPIIHRDLKPENLLLFGDSVKLADFGWSNHNENMRNTYCGTPDYLAPEMILRASHNEKLDVWSLGVLCFELLCGYAPFTPKDIKDRGPKMKTMESNILKGKFEIPSSVPSDAADLIRKALNNNPNLRISSKEFVEHPWFVRLGYAKEPQYSPPKQPLSFDTSLISHPPRSSNRQYSGTNPLMRELSPQLNRQPSRGDIYKTVDSPKQFGVLRPESGAMGANMPQFVLQVQTPPSPLASHQHTSSMGLIPNPLHQNAGYTYQNRPVQQTNPQTPIANSPGLPPKPHVEYSLPKDLNSNNDSRHNMSGDILSSEQSRIKKGEPLRLRSNSRSNLETTPDYQTPAKQVLYKYVQQNSQQTTGEPQNITTSTPRSDSRVVITGKPSGNFGNYVNNSATRPDTSPLRRAFGERTPLNAQLNSNREASPAPMIHQYQLSDVEQNQQAQTPPMLHQYQPAFLYTPQTPQQHIIQTPNTPKESYRPMLYLPQQKQFTESDRLLYTQASPSEQLRPPTPNRIRVSANDSQPSSLMGEIQGLRNRVRELEVENSKLKVKLNGGSSYLTTLEAEIEKLRANEVSLRQQTERLEKQRRSMEAATEVGENYKILKSEVMKIAEKIHEGNPSWFVSFGVTQPNSKTDVSLIQSVLSKATQSIQNETVLVSKYNELRKKYGLAHYCLLRYRELGNQLQGSSNRLLQSGHLGASSDDLVYCLQAHFANIQALEESPEYSLAQGE